MVTALCTSSLLFSLLIKHELLWSTYTYIGDLMVVMMLTNKYYIEKLLNIMNAHVLSTKWFVITVVPRWCAEDNIRNYRKKCLLCWLLTFCSTQRAQHCTFSLHRLLICRWLGQLIFLCALMQTNYF